MKTLLKLSLMFCVVLPLFGQEVENPLLAPVMVVKFEKGCIYLDFHFSNQIKQISEDEAKHYSIEFQNTRNDIPGFTAQLQKAYFLLPALYYNQSLFDLHKQFTYSLMYDGHNVQTFTVTLDPKFVDAYTDQRAKEFFSTNFFPVVSFADYSVYLNGEDAGLKFYQLGEKFALEASDPYGRERQFAKPEVNRISDSQVEYVIDVIGHKVGYIFNIDRANKRLDLALIADLVTGDMQSNSMVLTQGFEILKNKPFALIQEPKK